MLTLDNLGLNGKPHFVDQPANSAAHGSGVGEIHEMFVATLGAIHGLFVNTLGHGVGDNHYVIITPYMESTLGHAGADYDLLPYIEQLFFHS